MVEPAETAAEPTRKHWILIGAVLATAVLLVGGSSLADALLPDEHPIRAGEAVTVGGNAGYTSSVRFAEDGWHQEVDGRRLGLDAYRFERGPLELDVMSATLSGNSPTEAAHLWEGMRDIARTRDPAIRLGAPEPTTTDTGVAGLTGTVRSEGREGAAFVFPAPGGGSAVEMIITAAEATPGLHKGAGAISRSVDFSEEASA